jgi:hypothetical protein
MIGRGPWEDEDFAWLDESCAFIRASVGPARYIIGPKGPPWKVPRGSLKTTRVLYPSHCLLDLIQLLQVGLPSSHLIRRFLQAA